jgi:WD40 repeat protein
MDRYRPIIRIPVLLAVVTGSCKRTLGGDRHTTINCVDFSLDVKIVAAGDGKFQEAGSVRLYDTVTDDVKSTLSSNDDPVFSVCFSPCGTKIVSGGGMGQEDKGNGDFSIRIWDAKTGTQIGVVERSLKSVRFFFSICL